MEEVSSIWKEYQVLNSIKDRFYYGGSPFNQSNQSNKNQASC